MKKEIINPEPLVRLISKSAEFFDVTVEKIHSKRRFRNIVYARHMIMYYLYTHFDKYFNTVVIAKHIGDRDHSSVLHALHAMQDRFDVYPEDVERYARFVDFMAERQ